jgi:hypothetical protein
VYRLYALGACAHEGQSNRSAEPELALYMICTATNAFPHSTTVSTTAVFAVITHYFLCGVTVTQASPPAIAPPEVITTDAYSMLVAPELNANCAIPLAGAGFNVAIKTVEAVLSYTKVLACSTRCSFTVTSRHSVCTLLHYNFALKWPTIRTKWPMIR